MENSCLQELVRLGEDVGGNLLVGEDLTVGGVQGWTRRQLVGLTNLQEPLEDVGLLVHHHTWGQQEGLILQCSEWSALIGPDPSRYWALIG